MAPSKNKSKKQRQGSRVKLADKNVYTREQERSNFINNIDTLLDKADSIPDLEQRIQLYSDALKSVASSSVATLSNELKNIKQCDILEKKAELLAEIGDTDGALEDFNLALQLMSDVTCTENTLMCVSERKASLYMYVGQLSEGQIALSNYEKGIEHLQQVIRTEQARLQSLDRNTNETRMDLDDALQRKTNEQFLCETKSKLASAYCAAGELFMTDLCEDENAEERCESLINLAVEQTDQENNPSVDSLQLAASHRLSQNRGREAVDYILRVYELIRVGCEELSSLVGLRDLQESEKAECCLEISNHSAVQRLPSFEFRTQTVKILLECADVLKEDVNNFGPNDEEPFASLRKQCLDHAVDVLGSLLAENDEVIELFDLLGDTFSSKSRLFSRSTTQNDSELAVAYWERALDMLETAKVSIGQAQEQMLNEDDMIQRQFDEVLCRLDEINFKLDTFKKENMS